MPHLVWKPIEKRMIDPTTFATASGSFRTTTSKYWFGM
jgi:hypothetical protein